MGCLISTLIGTRKLRSLVISMLMSTLQDVGTYTGRAYENPFMGCLISTLIGTRKLCSLVISMLMSTLQSVGTYTGRAYGNPYMGCLISALIGTRKLCSLVISMHAHEHITGVGRYTGVLMRIPINGMSHKHAHRHTKIIYAVWS